MVKPQLSARIARTKDTAHRLTPDEGRPISDIVEPASSFYARISSYAAKDDVQAGDAELDALINENRKSHSGIDL